MGSRCGLLSWLCFGSSSNGCHALPMVANLIAAIGIGFMVAACRTRLQP
jgi:hypothetical protein